MHDNCMFSCGRFMEEKVWTIQSLKMKTKMYYNVIVKFIFNKKLYVNDITVGLLI